MLTKQSTDELRHNLGLAKSMDPQSVAVKQFVGRMRFVYTEKRLTGVHTKHTFTVKFQASICTYHCKGEKQYYVKNQPPNLSTC